MKRIFLFLAVAFACRAAMTDRYVNTAGAQGDGTGSSEANAMSYTDFNDYMVTGGSFTAAAGDRFYLKGGTTINRTTTNDTWINGGSATSPVVIQGYASTVTDGYQGRANDNGALTTTNMPLVTYTSGTLVLSGNFIILQSMRYTSTRNGAAIASSGTDNVIRVCSVANATTGASGECISISGRSTVQNCDVTLSNGGNAGLTGMTFQGTGSRALYNRVTSTAVGITGSGTGVLMLGNTIYGCTSHGISLTATGGYTNILNNTIVSNGADGIHVVTGTTVLHTIINNIITDNTGDAIDMVSTANAAWLGYQRTRDNGSDIANGGDWTTVTNVGEVTTDTGGASTDYNNAGSNDYRLIAGSPATSTGFPLKASIGANQRDQTSAGGSTAHSSTFAQ